MATSRVKSKRRPVVALPDVVTSRQHFKRKFSLSEMYDAFVFTPRAMAALIDNRRNEKVDLQRLERMQLAVTEVSGCTVCSYEHARMALRLGMSGEEIASFLSGHDDFVLPDDAKAIVFAQHFADSTGHPTTEAYQSLVEEYGAPAAHVMLSAVQVMLAGNAYGVPFSALQSRRKGKPFPDSSLVYELGMLFAGPILLAAAVIHGTLRRVVGLANISFEDDSNDPT